MIIITHVEGKKTLASGGHVFPKTLHGEQRKRENRRNAGKKEGKLIFC